MADRNLGRVAAPLALLAALLAVVAVIAVSGVSSTTSRDTPAPTRTDATRPVSHVRATPRAYVVKAGDTLTVIAGKTGVSLDEIMQLNPEVDPNALQTGQRLKLTP